MFEIIFIVTFSLFVAASITGILSWKSERNKFLKISKILFILAVICFIELGIYNFFSSYKCSFIKIASAIWGYFYFLSLCIIMITLYLFLKGKSWRNQLYASITIISPFISIIMLISLPFLDSSRKISFNTNNELFSYILPVHIIISLSGEILLFFSFAGSILYLIMEWQLKKKTSMKLIYQLPNLEFINNFNKWSISRSFIFITFGIIIGMIMDYAIYNTLSLWTAKEFHIYFSWIVIFYILVIRRNLKMTSHKASIMNMLLFILVMFLFIFTNIFIKKGFHSFI